jgi:hypothetical protein
LEELREKATPGEWRFDVYKGGSRIVTEPDISEFICAAVNAIPALSALLAEGKRLVEEWPHDYEEESIALRSPGMVHSQTCKRCGMERWLGIAQEQGRETERD